MCHVKVLSGVGPEIGRDTGVHLSDASVMVVLLELRSQDGVLESHITTDVAALFARVKSIVSATKNQWPQL